MYAWGCNLYGQLAHPNLGSMSDAPLLISQFEGVEESKKVVQISTGAHFSAALTKGFVLI